MSVADLLLALVQELDHEDPMWKHDMATSAAYGDGVGLKWVELLRIIGAPKGTIKIPRIFFPVYVKGSTESRLKTGWYAFDSRSTHQDLRLAFCLPDKKSCLHWCIEHDEREYRMQMKEKVNALARRDDRRLDKEVRRRREGTGRVARVPAHAGADVSAVSSKPSKVRRRK